MSELFPWTDESIATLKIRVSSGASAQEIANEFGVSRNSIIGKCGRLGLKLTGSRKVAPFVWTAALDDRLRALARTSSIADAARAIGASHGAVTNRGRRLNLRFASGKGENAAVVIARANRISARAPLLNPTPQQLEERRAEIATEARTLDCGSESSSAVSLFDLKHNHCRYPLWSGKADPSRLFFCGAPTTSETCSWCEEHLAVVAAKPTGSLSNSAMRQALGVAA